MMQKIFSKIPILLISILISILISVLLFVQFTYAWTSYTHEWICEKAGIDKIYPGIDCAAADYPATQSKYPLASFVNHHCTLNMTDCKARQAADKFLMNDTDDTAGILAMRGIAAHLYADSMVPAHWYSLDYDMCHKIFEDKVEEKLRDSSNERYIIFGKSFDTSKWTITMQCVTTDKTHQTVILYADNKYMDDVAKYVAEKMNVSSDKQPLNTAVKEYDFTIIVCIPILLIIAMLMFFLLNRKH